MNVLRFGFAVVLGGIFFYAQDAFLSSQYAISTAFSLLTPKTIYADPPKECSHYTGQCTWNGAVFCQDDGGERYPIIGATVAGYTGNNDRWATGTDQYGEFHFCANDGGDCVDAHGNIRPFLALVKSLPLKRTLPNGQLYENMKGGKAPKVVEGPLPDHPGSRNNRSNRHWEIRYHNCTPSSTDAPPADPCKDPIVLSLEKSSPNILNFSADVHVPVTDTKPRTAVFHLSKNGKPYGESQPIPLKSNGPSTDEKGDPVIVYTAQWSLEFPLNTGPNDRFRAYIVVSPPAPQRQSSQQPEAGTYLVEPDPINADLDAVEPEILLVAPSLHLGTFGFSNVVSGCNNLQFQIFFSENDITAPPPSL